MCVRVWVGASVTIVTLSSQSRTLFSTPLSFKRTAMVSADCTTVLAAVTAVALLTFQLFRLLASARTHARPLKLRVKKLSRMAVLPVRGSAGAAGYDLSSAGCVVIPARGKGLCHTDLSIALPAGVYGRIAPRSGLAWKHSIDVGAGVIDEDYVGNVGVVLFNHSDEDFRVNEGERVAQLILEKIAIADVEEVPEGQDMEATGRGSRGFGSTGLGAIKATPPTQR